VKPHHDGSEAYVLERPDELGGSATVRLRVRVERRSTTSPCVPSATASRASSAPSVPMVFAGDELGLSTADA
jgi:hypothetical protein